MGKLRSRLEALVYAGLKPQGPGVAPAEPAASRWRKRFEQFLTPPASTDPLYLSNRTVWQMLRAWAVLLVPAVIVLAVLALAWSGVFHGHDAPKLKDLTAAERAARVLPNFDTKIQLPTNHDVDIEDAHVEHGSPNHVVGLIKNNTGHTIASAEVTFDLTDRHWMRLGAVSTLVENLPPHSATPFRFQVAQDTAELVLVRDYHVQ